MGICETALGVCPLPRETEKAQLGIEKSRYKECSERLEGAQTGDAGQGRATQQKEHDFRTELGELERQEK